MSLSDGQGNAIFEESKRLANKHARPVEREDAAGACALAAVEAAAKAKTNPVAYGMTAGRRALHRMLKKERTRLDRAELLDIFAVDGGPGDPSDHIERMDRLNRSLASLDHPCRALLVRRFGLGGEPAETLKKIAAARGVSIPHVHQLLEAALTRLKALLQNNSDFST
jgi:RNA polymerase sigma factor (sigma-70 family)